MPATTTIATRMVRRQWRAALVPRRERKAGMGWGGSGESRQLAVSAENHTRCNFATVAKLHGTQMAIISGEMTTGLRERKKQQTRQAIHEAAMKLFAERGYDATTIADIADAAGISPRTFFSYFSAKEEAVFQKFDMAYEEFTRALQDRPEGMTALEALRDWIVREAHKYTPTAENLRLEVKLRAESPA